MALNPPFSHVFQAMTREASVSELTGAGDDQEIAKHEIICNIMIMYFDYQLMF